MLTVSPASVVHSTPAISGGIRGIIALLCCLILTFAHGADAPVGSFVIPVVAPGPEAFADQVLQAAIDTASTRGGGIVELGPGDFKLSRTSGDETVIIKSNVTLRGQGYATHIYLDPTTPPNPLRYYPVRIGSEDTPASNVIVENLRYTGNDTKIGGGSIMGFNARLGTPESVLLSCDNVTVRHCWIYDAKQAAGCTKPGGTAHPAAERLASQHKNWRVYGNVIDTCGNKAIEFAECNGGLIADNHITNVHAGPQVIFGSRNVQIRDNEVYFTDTGINITEGSNRIRVSGNHVEPVDSVKPTSAGACLIFRTEPQPHVSMISDVVVTGNVFRDQTTRAGNVIKFVTRDESLGCTYRAIVISDNILDGNTVLHDPRMPGKTMIEDLLLADNVCEGDIRSVPASTMISKRVTIRGNILRQAGNYTLQASDWIWADNSHSAGTLEIAPGAANNIIRNNTVRAAIVDRGTGTVLKDNVATKSEAADPVRAKND